MNDHITKSHKDQLLAFCRTVSPTTPIADGFTQMVHSMNADRCDEAFQVMSLAAGIVDGVRYGNWPTTKG